MTELEVRLEIAKLAAVQKGSFDLVFDEIAAKVFGKPQGSDLALVFETVGVAEAIADLERLEAVLLRVEKLKGERQPCFIQLDGPSGELLSGYMRRQLERDSQRRG